MDPQQLKSAAQFAPQAEKYARATSFQGGPDLEFAIANISPQKEWRMLDIATGGGHASFFFSPSVKSIVATDLTQEMIDAAKNVASEKGFNNISFQTATAESLPFPDASFDLVTCRIAPHHFSSIDSFISESKRVLVPGGVFLVIDGIGPESSEASTLYNNWERTRDPSHVRCLSMSEWREKLQRAGFTIDASTEVTRPHDFDDYMDRMSVNTVTKESLLYDLNSRKEITDWLHPISQDEKILFRVRNGVFVCKKN